MMQNRIASILEVIRCYQCYPRAGVEHLYAMAGYTSASIYGGCGFMNP